MGYSSISDVQNVIAQALTTATNPTTNSPRNLLEIGRVFDENLVSTSLIEWYIARSDEEINSFLSELYKVPLCELVDFEGRLFSPIDEYNSFIVLTHPCPLNPGDIIIIKSGATEERHEIDEIISEDTYTTAAPIQFAFPAGSRVVRVKLPEPIRFVSARLSAANIYDKYFSSQVAPGVSNYGKYMREQGHLDINNILNGRTILHGQHRIGRRFWNSNLDDRYALPDVAGSDKAAGRTDIDSLSQG